MSRATPLIFCLTVLATSAFADQAHAFSLSGTVWEEASAQTCNVDPKLLYAVALQESKRYAGGRMVAPNPYALNISDKGYHPSTRLAAEQLLKEGLANTKHIAVGAMQVSIRWNGSRVNNPRDLLDLRQNVLIGTQILCEMIAGNEGDLPLAIGRYHTPNPKLEHIARGYGENVIKIWRRLILLGDA